MVMPLFFMSCNQDISDSFGSDETRVFFSMDDFENVPLSRTTIHPDKNYSVTWAKGDVIGIFPYEGYQEPFAIPDEQANYGTATFDGGYWALKNGLKYNAYYPFDKTNFDSPEMKTKIPVSYEGQKQIGATCCVGSHAFTYSDWATAGDGSVYFQFHHIGSLVVITLPIPATTAYSSFTIEAENAIIPIKGTYDLTSKLTADKEPSFVADASSLSKSISVELIDFTGTANTNATIYMMLPPVDLSSETLTLTLKATHGGSCVYSVPGQNVLKGKKTEYIGKPTNSTVTGTTYEWLIEQGILNADYAFDITLTGSTRLASAKVPNNSATLSQFASIIKSLKVTGDLNSTDIKFIRSLSALEALDLSNANIIEGGDSYYTAESTNYTTTANVFPSFFMMESNLNKLKYIALPNSVTEIQYYAFASSNVTALQPDVIYSLNNIVLGNNLKTISYYAFGCSISTIHLPKSVESIGIDAFAFCPNLEAITVDENNNKLYSIDGVLFEKIINTSYDLLCCPPNKQIFSFPADIKVRNISQGAFANCKNLETITLPQGIDIIGNYAFDACSSMKSIYIPSTVTQININPFRLCSAMEEIHLGHTTPPSWYLETGDSGIPVSCKLYVPNTNGWTNSSTYLNNWSRNFTIVRE